MTAHISSKRPIVGLCLKRYTVSPSGKATRLQTKVDIPTEIGLPHFIHDDVADSDGSLSRNFKLSLQALVCHRGNSVNSGHYIAIVRGTSADATPASASSQSIDDPSRYWIRFDDMADERVALVDVNKALETESPYLLFYQILPIDEDAAEANLKHANTSSVSSSSVLELDTDHPFRVEPSSAPIPIPSRPSADVTRPGSSEHSLSPVSAKRASVHSDAADHGGHLKTNSPVVDNNNNNRADDGDNNKSASATAESVGRNESIRLHKGRSNSSGHGHEKSHQATDNNKRLSSAISRFAGRRLGKEKMDESPAEEEEGFVGDAAMTENSSDKSEQQQHHHQNLLLRPSTSSGGNSRVLLQNRIPRARSRDILKGRDKQKEWFRDRTGKRIDRECIVQ